MTPYNSHFHSKMKKLIDLDNLKVLIPQGKNSEIFIAERPGLHEAAFSSLFFAFVCHICRKE